MPTGKKKKAGNGTSGKSSEVNSSTERTAMSAVQNIAERTPPHAPDAEMATLGAMMYDSNASEIAIRELKRDDFYRTSHKHIFDAILELDAKNQTPDEVLICEVLTEAGKLEEVGGREYINKLVAHGPNAFNVDKYAKIISEKALHRKLIGVASNILRESEQGVNASTLLDAIEQKIYDIASKNETSQVQHIKDVLLKSMEDLHVRFENDGVARGVEIHVPRLNKVTGGFSASDLIILAARPSVGKTALALNFARHAAAYGDVPVLVFSLEMAEKQVAERLLAMHGSIDSNRIRTGQLTPEDLQRISDVAEELGELPISIDDTPGITPTALRSKARKWARGAGGKGLIIIDYLQLMTSSYRTDNREREVAMISGSLKALARELDMPVIALSQLSRKTEDHKMPRLSDLRESGAIEQDADLVMLLHRNRDEETGALINESVLNLAKHRNGATDVIKLMYKPEHMMFAEEAMFDGDDIGE